ncbi:MAG: 50S ribosomal protein L29 [Microcystis aeruginosa Ma_QC_Ch_20071001_S25]|jgi:large subunit ribosomal protein L29|uniref:Large ribosomal subunit protein uL29 n=6 Tax=Microcystis TaxID=1125 RepID=A0A552H728_MICVR|nr:MULTISPECIES: 50S ribosomal protein L29 [Microcystis]MCA2762068.1 50S ribosomal protein L29 [Microcystis sp. M151S2]MCU7245744.1 50S ribosomal protein L29 [Microcystis aeruginosa WS75]MDJ0546459.1 50S ribosomal protein L29 [Microcystis sp. M53601_WE4]NCQ69762.1 50S ribosomal protein L29 [Microcystis aeruginosa W13-16]NCQ74296.1 50S ribosomal protein L29 [Microcystis aeruginosa W13-13]NCQ78739.1 50S ribosomal protein L29 [Microcystis aeruginosa W13-15]NCR00861.1 50S ribosomal protein L29 [
MALPKIAEVRKMSDDEIADAILAAKKKLFELRLQQATRRLEKTHEFKHTRHRLGQLLTVERERQLAQSTPEA